MLVVLFIAWIIPDGSLGREAARFTIPEELASSPAKQYSSRILVLRLPYRYL